MSKKRKKQTVTLYTGEGNPVTIRGNVPPLFDRGAKTLPYYDWYCYFPTSTTTDNGDGTYTHTFGKGIE